MNDDARYLVRPWSIRHHFSALKSFGCHFGRESRARREKSHVDALSEVDQLEKGSGATTRQNLVKIYDVTGAN